MGYLPKQVRGEQDCRHGKGVLTQADGTVQAGWFEKDKFIGPEPPRENAE